MLEFIFHQRTTLNDCLLLYRREIIRQQAFQHAKDFEQYVTYFKTAVLLKTNIGKNIPYLLQIIKDDQKLHEESLVENNLEGFYSPDLFSNKSFSISSEQGFFIEALIKKADPIKSNLGGCGSPPCLNNSTSQNSGLQDYFVGQVMLQKDSIMLGIEEFYTNNVSGTLQYLIKAEKIIYRRFTLIEKLKHLSTHFLTPLINLEHSHTTSLFHDKHKKLNDRIYWNEYARRLLLKLITENIITINVASVLQSNCKTLLLHKIKHTDEAICKKQYLDQLNLFLEKLEYSFDHESIHSTELSLSLEKTSLVKILWYICKHEENLIHPFIAYLSNIHSSSLHILLQQLTKHQHNSALMISIINNNFVAFQEILKQIKKMNHDDIYSLLSLKNSDGNTCIMLSANAHPSYADALLNICDTLPLINQTMLLTDINQQQKNAFMVAIENPQQTLSTFCSVIRNLESHTRSMMMLQKTSSNFTTLGLLIKYKSNHLTKIAPFFEDLSIENIFQILSHNILPRKIESKKVKPKSIKTSRVSRDNKLILKHRRESKSVSTIEINRNKEKNIFQYALTLRAEITSVGWKNIYSMLFMLLNKLPLEKRCIILGRREPDHSTTLHLAFSRSAYIADMFIQYITKNIPPENRLELLTKINQSKDNALFILAKHHIELLTSLILSFSNPNSNQAYIDNTFNKKNYDHQTLLVVAICTQTPEERARLKKIKATDQKAYHDTLAFQTRQVMHLIQALQITLSEKNFNTLLRDKDRHDKSILTHARNIDNIPLFIAMIQWIFALSNTSLRNDIIEEIFTFKLPYDIKNTCRTVTTLLETLNNAGQFHDLPALTQTLNPHGWTTLSLSISNQPGKIIENLALYAEIKQSKLNAGEVSSCFSYFWSYTEPERKINTARNLISELKEQSESHKLNAKLLTQIIKKMSERERCILNHGRLHAILDAYYREEQKQIAIRQALSRKNRFWRSDSSTSRLLNSDTTKTIDHPSYLI